MHRSFLSAARENAHWIFAILGVCYAFLLTDSIGSGIFDRARLCYAFNEYALSILDGRLDLPPLAIGLEGRFTNDGRVFTYYGALPALLRIPLIPFLDLSEACVAKPMMFVYTIAIGFVCHITVVRIGRVDGAVSKGRGRFLVALILVLIWFASPLAILTSNAAQTYEPIALALLLTAIFMGIITYEIIVEKRVLPYRIVSLAIVAALCVHARPNVAVALYAVVVFLCLMTLIRYRREIFGRSGSSGIYFSHRDVKRVAISFIILFASGASILAMNYARWQSLSFSMPLSVGEYGYPKFVEPFDSPRRVSSREHKLGMFSIRRVPSNAVFHMLGGWESRSELLEYFGGGYVRIAPPYSRTTIMWTPWYLGLIYLLFRLKEISRWLGPRATYAASIWIGSAGISYLILAYPTVTFRYKVELWPLLYCSCLFLLGWRLRIDKQLGAGMGKMKKVVIAALLISTSITAGAYSYQQNRENAASSFDDGEFPDIDCDWNNQTGWSSECIRLPQ